jgi:putative ABC transport system substrate-binding protein
MRRRDFIISIGGAAAAWPLTAQAQSGVPIVGYLSPLGRNDRTNLVDAFRRGLGETGYVEGRNVAMEYRFAENETDRLPVLAAELVSRRAAVIAATGGTNSVLAAKTATTAIPIVFTYGGDPVQAGFVATLNRPSGNITGVTFRGSSLIGKLLGLMHDIVPNAATIALLLNPTAASPELLQSDARAAAGALGLRVDVLNASTPGEIDIAIASLRGHAGALVVSDPYFVARRQQIMALARRDAIPVVTTNREFVAEGALMTYGNDALDLYRRAGTYAGRILKGEKPTELPIDQATKFELVINFKAAKTLGLNIPPQILSIADEVIE